MYVHAIHIHLHNARMHIISMHPTWTETSFTTDQLL